jgi:hypothetical protein
MDPRYCEKCAFVTQQVTDSAYVWVDTYVKEKTIAMLGIEIHICRCGVSPVIPAAGPLCDLILATAPEDQVQLWRWTGFPKNGGAGWQRVQ